MKIAITGGDGLLSTEILKLDNSFVGFDKKTLNVFDYNSFSVLNNFDVILHTAALKDVTKIPGNEINFIKTNIIGTANISNYCLKHNKKLVYISTDYVYRGEGNHKETDSVYPFNNYAWSKLGGECSVRFLKNSLIIRTSFGPSIFPYKKAFTNFYTSKDYVDIIAPLIIKAIKNNLQGVINIGTKRKSIFTWANQRNKISKSKGIEKDFSLNTEKFYKICE
jgi:dTDP-4-dehydrorhamnose reductase